MSGRPVLSLRLGAAPVKPARVWLCKPCGAKVELAEGLADELQLVIAPLFVGHQDATRFVGAGRFPFSGSRRARLVESRPIGDVVLLRYALSARFRESSC